MSHRRPAVHLKYNDTVTEMGKLKTLIEAKKIYYQLSVWRAPSLLVYSLSIHTVGESPYNPPRTA